MPDEPSKEGTKGTNPTDPSGEGVSGGGHDSIYRTHGDNPTDIAETDPALARELGDIALKPGEVVADRFEVIEQIGFGGMGAVYRVKDRELGQERALKVMLPSLLDSDKAQERFLEEIRITQGLRHDGIVTVYDLGKDGERGLRFFTMEYVPGKTLNRVLKERGGKLPVDEALDITRQVCGALAYAHQYTIHRDLKPQNIMVRPGGSITLLDFGLAKLMSPGRMTKSSMALGTAYYQAPEQSVHLKELDERADIYSLGVVLYQMLTGKIPIGAMKPPSQLNRAVSKKLDAVVMKCLAPEPEDRFANAGELAAALPKGSGARRQSPWAPLVAVATVMVAALGAWWVYSNMDFTTGDTGTTGNVTTEGTEGTEIVAAADEMGTQQPETVSAPPIEDSSDDDGAEMASKDEGAEDLAPEPEPVEPPGPTEETVAEARDAALDARMAIGPDERRYAEAEVEAGRDAWDRAEGLEDLEARQAAYEKSRESYREAKAVTPERKRIAESTPEAVFEEVTVAENVEVDGQEGIRIDGRVVVKNLEGERIELAAYVFDEDGDVIAGKDAKYRSARNGQAYVGKEMKVAAREETVADWGLFLPYDQLNLRREGRHSLKIEPVLWEYSSGRGNELVKGEPRFFTHEVKRQGRVAGEARTFDGIEFVWIPPGEFMMGAKLSPQEVASRYGGKAEWYEDEHPRHRVTISEGFWMSKYEITNEQYRRYDSGHDSGSYKGLSLNGAKQPVVEVSWNDATNFCQWLSRQGDGTYRLPSEAEWEYAARAGSTTVVPWGDLDATTGRYANVSDRTAKAKWSDWNIVDTDDGYAVTAPMGSYRPNQWGLHDMIGNVYEWCRDRYGSDYYENSPSTDPPGPSSGEDRVLRGGSWGNAPRNGRSADRSGGGPAGAWDSLGFRVVRLVR